MRLEEGEKQQLSPAAARQAPSSAASAVQGPADRSLAAWPLKVWDRVPVWADTVSCKEATLKDS